MADRVLMVKTDKGTLAPADPDAKQILEKLGAGEYVVCEVRKARDANKHRKFFAMLNLAFDLWNPAEQAIAGHPAKKSRETFRKEVTIAAGYYDVEAGLHGPKLVAQSIAWDKMDDLVFREVYEAVYAVLASGVLEGVSREEAERMAEELWEHNF
jgi:hypothetical protein